jgi:hypothetical protein
MCHSMRLSLSRQRKMVYLLTSFDAQGGVGAQSNIVVHGYTIEGIDAGIDAIGREHVNVFYNKVMAEMNESAQSW